MVHEVYFVLQRLQHQVWNVAQIQTMTSPTWRWFQLNAGLERKLMHVYVDMLHEWNHVISLCRQLHF